MGTPCLCSLTRVGVMVLVLKSARASSHCLPVVFGSISLRSPPHPTNLAITACSSGVALRLSRWMRRSVRIASMLARSFWPSVPSPMASPAVIS